MQGFIYFLGRFVSFAIKVYTLIIIVRAIMSWVTPDPYSPIIRTLDRITEPMLYPIRRVLSRFAGGIPIDFSPFVAIILLYLFKIILLKILWALRSGGLAFCLLSLSF